MIAGEELGLVEQGGLPEGAAADELGVFPEGQELGGVDGQGFGDRGEVRLVVTPRVEEVVDGGCAWHGIRAWPDGRSVEPAGGHVCAHGRGRWEDER